MAKLKQFFNLVLFFCLVAFISFELWKLGSYLLRTYF